MPNPAPNSEMPGPDHGPSDHAVVAETLVYDQLRRIAHQYVRREPVDLTIEATALVHEVYLQFSGRAMPSVNDEGHFIAICARLMRQVLVNHARRRNGRKRVHAQASYMLDGVVAMFEERCTDLEALDSALGELHEQDPRKASVIELRFFAGLSDERIADLLDVSTRTVRREWQIARAWLRQEVDR